MTTLSIIICTYNGTHHIRRCLDSILRQSFTDFEILCVDGMSKDDTQAIINEYASKDKRIKLLINLQRLPEGEGNGKWLGYHASTGNVIGFIDQDNELQDKTLFQSVINLFLSPLSSSFIGVLGGQTHRLLDPPVVRYVALFGTDSFFAYRSLDFIRHLTSPDTLTIKEFPFQRFTLTKEHMLLTGGNCFFYSRKDLESIGGYTQDVLVVQDLLHFNKTSVVVIPDATKHYAEKNLYTLAKKKFFWGRNYHSSTALSRQFNYFPQNSVSLKAFIKNLLFNIFIIPNFIITYRMYHFSRDPVCFFFPLLAFFNTIAYGATFLAAKITRR